MDTGLQMIAGTDGETATQGLDGLGDRCKKYYQQGARFGQSRQPGGGGDCARERERLLLDTCMADVMCVSVVKMVCPIDRTPPTRTHTQPSGAP